MKLGNMIQRTEIPAKLSGGKSASEESLAVLAAAKALTNGDALTLECADAKEAGLWAARARGSLFKEAGLTSSMRGSTVYVYRAD